jgi:TetR/AcrR family transcriptional regulator, ethionamide resistance regulator
MNALTKAVRSRNATESAILDAAREALAELGYERMTIDAIAKRAFVSRTAVYFYFDNKRAVVDRLIQRAFSDMYAAGEPYLEGEGDPRIELRTALTRVVTVVNREAPILLLATSLSGQEDRMPSEWAPYIERFVIGSKRRIQRDQERGLAPDDIPAAVSSRALLAMVERHVTLEIVIRQGDVTESIRALAELWYRAVYSLPPAAPIA